MMKMQNPSCLLRLHLIWVAIAFGVSAHAQELTMPSALDGIQLELSGESFASPFLASECNLKIFNVGHLGMPMDRDALSSHGYYGAQVLISLHPPSPESPEIGAERVTETIFPADPALVIQCTGGPGRPEPKLLAPGSEMKFNIVLQGRMGRSMGQNGPVPRYRAMFENPGVYRACAFIKFEGRTVQSNFISITVEGLLDDPGVGLREVREVASRGGNIGVIDPWPYKSKRDSEMLISVIENFPTSPYGQQMALKRANFCLRKGRSLAGVRVLATAETAEGYLLEALSYLEVIDGVVVGLPRLTAACREEVTRYSERNATLLTTLRSR